MNDGKFVENDDEMEQFDELERGFRRVIQDLGNEAALDQFRQDYEELYNSLKDSHEKNMNLINKCKDLNNNILANANKISSVMQLSQNDQRTIVGLRHEFEKAWKMVEVTQDRETKTKEVMETLKQEVSNLSRSVEQGGNAAFQQEASLQEISDMNVILKKEIIVQTKQITSIRNDIDKKNEELEKYRKHVENGKVECEQLNKELEAERVTLEGLSNICHESLDQMTDVKNGIKDVQEIAKAKSAEIKTKKALIAELNSVFYEEQRNLKASGEDLSDSKQAVRTANVILEDKKKNSDKILNSMKTKQEKYDGTDTTLAEFSTQLNGILAEIKTQNVEYKELLEVKHGLQEEHSKIRAKLTNAHKEILVKTSETTSKRIDIQLGRVHIERTNHEWKDIQNKKGEERAGTEVEQRQITILNNELIMTKSKNHDGRRKMVIMTEEMDKYESDALSAKNLRLQIEEDVKIRENQVNEMIINLHEIRERINHQLSVNETIQNERDLACQMLETSIHENIEFEKTNKALMSSLQLLKDEIRSKDAECLNMHLYQKKVVSQTKVLSRQCKDMKKKLKEADEITTEIRNKISRNFFFISEAELAAKKEKQVTVDIKFSSEMITSTTSKRKAETKILYEKTHILQSLLDKGTVAFQRLNEQIEDLKEELNRVVYFNKKLNQRNRHGNTLKIEMIRIEKALLCEQGKAKALETELENPFNIHRWTIIEGTDPELANLLRMNVSLRDRLMVIISQLQRLNQSKKELEEKYVVQEKHLMKSYGGDYEQERAFLISLLKKMDYQLKEMREQASYQQNEVNDSKENVFTVRTMVREEKTELLNTKKKVEKVRGKTACGTRSRKPLQPSVYQPSMNKEVKFVGGGFAVGTIQFPTKSEVKPRTQTRIRNAPELVLPSKSKSPRRPETSIGVKTPKKALPHGWNSKRSPIQPLMPTAAELSQPF